MADVPVHVVIVKPDGYAHGETFRELAETLSFGLQALGIPSRILVNGFEPGCGHVVLGWHLLDPEPALHLPSDCILYNLEQFDDRNRELLQRFLVFAERFQVWDYSQRNIEILRKAGLQAPVRHVPIGFVPQLQRIGKAPEQDIDVLFYGSLNERRRKILQELEQEGLRVHAAFGVYGAERDALISRAKVVLNLHFYETSIFEMVRVSYLLANRKAVVAECHSLTEVEDDMRVAAVLVPYGHLVAACVQLVNAPLRREAVETRAFETISRREEPRYLAEALKGEAPAAPREPLPAVSVVMITKDRPGFLRRALQSLLDQQFRDFEVLLVNDGGEKVTGIVQDFASRGLRILLQDHPASKGQSAARNTAMLMAQGRWIAYLDDDDLFYPEHLELLVGVLKATGAAVVYSDSLRVIEEERGGAWAVVSREVAMSRDFDRDQFLWDNLTPINNVVHERMCWEVCGLHDETLPVLEDWDYWIRLSRLWDFVHVPKVTAEVRWRSDQSNITFRKQDQFPECRRRIGAKVHRLLAKERSRTEQATPPALREALLFEPDWKDAEWVEVVLAYVHAFKPGEPVALVLPMDPRSEGQLSLEEAQGKLLDIVSRSGHESFPDIILLDKLSELLETLQGFARAQWIPKGRGNVEGLEGEVGSRFAKARSALSAR